MGRSRSSSPYAGKDYSGTSFDVDKSFESQWGGMAPQRKTGFSSDFFTAKDKENAQARYNALTSQSKSLMSGATGGGGPAVKSNEGQGLDFSALEKPPGQASKKGSLLTTSSMGSLFTR